LCHNIDVPVVASVGLDRSIWESLCLERERDKES